MHPKRKLILMILPGILLLIASGIWLTTVSPVSAQCGSSASSCKNCHEVQGKLPVNNDGTAWHTSHAFGDFCYICHAGNQQATDESGAHTGIVPPLSDIKASCLQCHPSDLQDRAQVYATALGVEIGSGTSTGTTSTPSDGTGTDASQPVINAPVTTELDVNDPNLVNYVQNYDQIVLGKFPTNWGNVILFVMIGMMTVGGGGFVIINEKRIRFSTVDANKLASEYPRDVLDMLPIIARLNSRVRSSLKNILNDKQKTKKLFGVIDAVFSDEKNEE